jgi:hypothetical protein
VIIRTDYGKIIIGQNDKYALVLSEKPYEEQSKLHLGSELVSFIIYNERIYCGLSDNRVIVLNEETLEILSE